jgi:iron-sulfur cluster repair protein YtfE (RIC family)
LIQRNVSPVVRTYSSDTRHLASGELGGMGGSDIMDIFEKLMEDHRSLEECFAEIEKTTEEDAALREQLFKQLQARLEAHEMFEEELLYPEIDQIPQMVSMIGDAYEEHAELESTAQDLAHTPVTDSDWTRRFHGLRQRIQEHVRMEENIFFPVARAELDEARAEELARQLEDRRNQL